MSRGERSLWRRVTDAEFVKYAHHGPASMWDAPPTWALQDCYTWALYNKPHSAAWLFLEWWPFVDESVSIYFTGYSEAPSLECSPDGGFFFRPDRYRPDEETERKLYLMINECGYWTAFTWYIKQRESRLCYLDDFGGTHLAKQLECDMEWYRRYVQDGAGIGDHKLAEWADGETKAGVMRYLRSARMREMNKKKGEQRRWMRIRRDAIEAEYRGARNKRKFAERKSGTLLAIIRIKEAIT